MTIEKNKKKRKLPQRRKSQPSVWNWLHDCIKLRGGGGRGGQKLFSYCVKKVGPGKLSLEWLLCHFATENWSGCCPFYSDAWVHKELLTELIKSWACCMFRLFLCCILFQLYANDCKGTVWLEMDKIEYSSLVLASSCNTCQLICNAAALRFWLWAR